MKYLKKIIFTMASIILILQITANASTKSTGVVTSVSSRSIKIRMSSTFRIHKGDKVLVYYQTNSGLKMKIGEWKVTKKTKKSIYAKSVDIIQNAREGQMAEIFSYEKKTTIKSVKHNKPIAQTKYNPTSPEEQNTLGWNYQNGSNGFYKDYKKAAYWYRKAAKQGYAKAQDNLGWVYQNGIGVEVDYKKAAYWYKKAAFNGFANAQNNLAGAYERGIGVSRNYKKAVYWYMKSAKAGKILAQSNLGFMYMKGLGIEQDDIKAFYWLKKAADSGNAVAQGQIGIFYYNGTGVIKDRKKAIYFLRKSARQGNKISQNNLKSLGFSW